MLSSDESVHERMKGRYLVRSSVLNFASQTLPLALTLLLIPILIGQLGADRFGILVFLLSMLTIFGISDLGIGYVVTQLVATRLGIDDSSSIPQIFWTCLALLLIIGIVLLFAFVILTPWLVDWLSVPQAFHKETYRSLIILSFCFPLAVFANVCRGLLEAHHKFVLRNVIVLVNGLLMLGVPAAVVMFTSRLDVIALTLSATRLLILLWYLVGCLAVVPDLSRTISFRPEIARQAFRLSGWMTIVTIINPLLIYSDRFFISGLVSVAAVGYYFVPYELATKLSVIVFSITTVLLPTFAITTQRDEGRAIALFEIGLKISLVVVFIEAFALSAFADIVMLRWLGPTVAEHSALVLQLILVGVFVNAAGALAISFVLGVGRPDIVAKLYLLEAILFLPTTFLLIKMHGIAGAAIGWSLRVACDSLLLLWMARRLMRPARADHGSLWFLTFGTLALLGLLLPIRGVMWAAYILIVPIALCGAAWCFLLTEGDRDVLRRTITWMLAGKWFFSQRSKA